MAAAPIADRPCLTVAADRRQQVVGIPVARPLLAQEANGFGTRNAVADIDLLVRVSEIIDGPLVAIIDGMGWLKSGSSTGGLFSVRSPCDSVVLVCMWVVPFPFIFICGTGTAATGCAACELMRQAGAGRGGR